MTSNRPQCNRPVRVLRSALLLILCVAGLAVDASAHENADLKAGDVGAQTLSPESRAVVETLESYAAAVASKDLARVKPLLNGNDFTYFEGTFVNVGWDSYSSHMAPELAVFENPKYQLVDIHPFVSGDLAYATFTWSMDVTVKSEQFAGGKHPVSMTGKGTAVLSRLDGKWRIRHLHTATSPPKKLDDH